MRFLATTPTSKADQSMTESGSGLFTIPVTNRRTWTLLLDPGTLKLPAIGRDGDPRRERRQHGRIAGQSTVDAQGEVEDSTGLKAGSEKVEAELLLRLPGRGWRVYRAQR